MKLVDLTLQPVPPDFVPQTLRRWLVEAPVGAEALLAERLAAARDALRSGGGPGPRLAPSSPLERALGTALAQEEPYWLERSCGLRALAAEEPELGALLRQPVELLALSFPGAASLPLGRHSVWLPAGQVGALHRWLRERSDELRERLRGAGVFSYFVALVEVTRYCLDRDFGLLELQGVATLEQRPNPRFCRGFFQRPVEDTPLPPVPPLRLTPTPARLRAVEEALEEGQAGRGRRLLEALVCEGAPSPDHRLLLAWCRLLEGAAPLSCPEEIAAVPGDALSERLRPQRTALLGRALLEAGRPAEAIEPLREALLGASAAASDAERLARAALASGAALAEAAVHLRQQLVGLGRDFDPDSLDWVHDPELAGRLPEPELYARLLALRGCLSLRLGFPAQAEHMLEHALLLDPEQEDARRCLAGISG